MTRTILEKTYSRIRVASYPINSYFEWETRGKQKLPHKFELVDSPLLYLGGIYDIWRRFDGVEFYSCSIITINATDRLSKIHPRMPYIVE